MNDFYFADFVSKIETVLDSMKNEFSCSNSPTDFEKFVVEASKQVIESNQLDCLIDYTEGGHSFPDIVYSFGNGKKYGIEVKSSTNANSPDNSWGILGNSILGSTRVDVDDLYIVFIKINKNGCFIKSARYENSVSDVVVTHSPRYKLDLAQNPTDSFFHKSGISYNEMKSSSDPIGLVTEYFRQQGLTAWWIAESTPAAIKTWEEVELTERKKILAQAFVLFPELIYSTGSKKYKRLAKWLVANYSIVDSSLRDKFSAGGRVDIKVRGVLFEKLPQVLGTLMDHFSEFKKSIQNTSLDDLCLNWDDYSAEVDSTQARYEYWYNCLSTNLKSAHPDELDFVTSLLSEVYRP